MSYIDSPYFHVGRATDLSGKDRLLYRAFEILPAVFSWGTLFIVVLLCFIAPLSAAIFIIIFDVYWLLKTIYLSIHLRQNWRRMQHNMEIDWGKRISNLKHDHLFHLILLPFYKEPESVLRGALEAILRSHYDLKKMFIVLAAEEKGGVSAKELAQKLEKEYKEKFGGFLVTVHPADVPGEMAGKGSNIAYAARTANEKLILEQGIPDTDVIVSAFDIDTVVYPHYFGCLTWHFLTEENPYKRSFQPVPVYHNNLWEAPMLSRVVAVSGTFWQMIQQERPERLSTFSSHSMSLVALKKVGFWQRNMVNEDSRIFWNSYVGHDGDYEVVPMAYPVSLDANVAPSFFETMQNVYKQQRRWTYGVENIPYTFLAFVKNKMIPLKKKFFISFIQIESFWSLATNPLMIFFLGWLPLVVGGREFNDTVLSYNLPIITRNLMFLAMAGLFLSAYISMKFLPPKPGGKNWKDNVSMVLQWLFIPITMTIFGSIPALESQTRLALGKYMGFWVTPKGGIQKGGAGSEKQ